MRLLMVSGDRQVAIGEQGPFYSMQREFSRYFERIDVLCPRPERAPSVLTIWDRVHFHPADRGRLGMVDYVAEKGAELIAAHGHELIVSHDYGWFYNGVGSARLSSRTGVPYVSEIHHVPGVPVAADARERFDRAVARFYVRWARSRARAFRVVNAGEMAPLLEKWGVPREQIAVLPSLYIDLSVFRPPPRRPAPEQDVLFVGRMVQNKGVHRILDALAELARRGRPASALFVGKGPLASAAREHAQRAGLAERVRFVEWVARPEDLARTYAASRAVVCASTCEGGPRFTVEALACGTPVVSTPVGMMVELLADGRAGALCGFDAASLADALERVLGEEERRAALGRAGIELAARFEYSRTIRGYAEGLHRLAGREVRAA